MNDTVTAAIVGAIAGIITGSISSLIAPWANWGIEKRKQKLAYRRELIGKWRKMIQDVLYDYNNRVSDYTFRGLLEEHEDYYSLKPHLNAETINLVTQIGGIRNIADPEARRAARTADENSKIGNVINNLTNEVSKIEREWDLI
jgi:hypothetical protein